MTEAFKNSFSRLGNFTRHKNKKTAAQISKIPAKHFLFSLNSFCRFTDFLKKLHFSQMGTNMTSGLRV